MTYPKVSIIVVNFNQKLLTLNCLKSLEKVTYPNYEVIVVDNNSQDGSTVAVSRRYPQTKQIVNLANLGYVGGNNIGIKHARGKYLLILNNDTKVTPSFIEPLIEDFQKCPDLGIVQSKIFIMDKPDLLDNVASYLTNTGFIYHVGYLEKNKPEYQTFREIFAAKGACMMIDRKILKLGAFDDQFWCYFEETDLCWRAWVMGYKIGFEPRSVIIHKMGATSTTMKSAFIHYHSFKNRIRTIIKNTAPITLLWMLPIHLTTCIGLAIFFLFSGQVKGSLSILKAILWNLQMFDETWKIRKKIQSKRKVSDNEIFNRVMKNPPLSFYLHHLSLVRDNLQNDRTLTLKIK